MVAWALLRPRPSGPHPGRDLSLEVHEDSHGHSVHSVPNILPEGLLKNGADGASESEAPAEAGEAQTEREDVRLEMASLGTNSCCSTSGCKSASLIILQFSAPAMQLAVLGASATAHRSQPPAALQTTSHATAPRRRSSAASACRQTTRRTWCSRASARGAAALHTSPASRLGAWKTSP